MTGAVVGAGAPQRGASAIDCRAEDRWISTPVRKASLAMAGVVIASIIIHAGILLLAAAFGGRTVPTPPKETVVELVQEPAPAPKPPAVPTDRAEDAASEPKAAEAPKAEPTKSEPSEAEPIKPEQAKLEEAKLEQATLEQAKPEPRQSSAPERGDPEPAKAAETSAVDQRDAKIAEKEAADSLRQELDSLKAEQEALKSEAEAAAERQTVDKATDGMDAQGMGAQGMGAQGMGSQGMGSQGMGTMPSSFSAVQLPQLSEIEGEVTGYEQIVFSQLARAKGVRRHMGIVGTAGIVFTIDTFGKLVNVTIAHPSGSVALDDEAMQIVSAAAPFPKPPPGSSRTIAANFNFVPQSAP